MKKQICSIAILAAMLSGSAFAVPRVGDKTTYDLFSTIGGKGEKGTMTVTVTALDPIAQKATSIYELDYYGKSSSTHAEDFSKMSEEAGALIVQSCEQKGGARVIVKTAGMDIETCAFIHLDGTQTTITYVGAVPGVSVKNDNIDSATGNFSTMILTSVTRGL